MKTEKALNIDKCQKCGNKKPTLYYDKDNDIFLCDKCFFGDNQGRQNKQ